MFAKDLIMDIGQRFGINKSTASWIFLNMVDVLHERLESMLVWPEREKLRETMLMPFRVHFGTKIVVIIDCLEVFLETPSNLSAQAWTWPSYKHNNSEISYWSNITRQYFFFVERMGW